MSRHINLLPWRLKSHQRQSRMFLWQLLALGLTLATLTAGIDHQRHQLSATLAQQNQDLARISDTLRRLEQQINQLRTSYHHQEPPSPVTPEKAMRTLALLSDLPLLQGELAQSLLQAEKLVLTGYALDQTEFERINRFLSAEPAFAAVKLDQFIPQPNSSLQFQFMLIFKEPE